MDKTHLSYTFRHKRKTINHSERNISYIVDLFLLYGTNSKIEFFLHTKCEQQSEKYKHSVLKTGENH